MVTYTTISANLMLRALGLSMYLACLGLDAGTHFFETVFRPEGALWVGLGFAITVIPVILVAAVSIKWMKIDFGSVAGMLCGSMSNPMALNYVNSTVDSDTPFGGLRNSLPVDDVREGHYGTGDFNAIL